MLSSPITIITAISIITYLIVLILLNLDLIKRMKQTKFYLFNYPHLPIIHLWEACQLLMKTLYTKPSSYENFLTNPLKTVVQWF